RLFSPGRIERRPIFAERAILQLALRWRRRRTASTNGLNGFWGAGRLDRAEFMLMAFEVGATLVMIGMAAGGASSSPVADEAREGRAHELPGVTSESVAGSAPSAHARVGAAKRGRRVSPGGASDGVVSLQATAAPVEEAPAAPPGAAPPALPPGAVPPAGAPPAAAAPARKPATAAGKEDGEGGKEDGTAGK